MKSPVGSFLHEAPVLAKAEYLHSLALVFSAVLSFLGYFPFLG